MKRYLLLRVLMLLAMPLSAHAVEGDPSFALTLAEYNAVNPKQSDLFERGSRLTGGKVLDSQNKTIGDIRDIMIDEGGNIVAIDGALNRLKGGGVNLPLNYASLALTPVSGGYKLGQTARQVEDMLPQLLSDIQTSSGTQAQSLSVNRLIGAGVETEQGVRLGKIEDVIFESEGARIHSLLVRVNYKSVSGKSVAIPMNAVRYSYETGRPQLTLTQAQAEALLAFAK